MPNTFLEVKEIARQALPRLIENLVFPNLVHKDFSNDFVQVVAGLVTVIGSLAMIPARPLQTICVYTMKRWI